MFRTRRDFLKSSTVILAKPLAKPLAASLSLATAQALADAVHGNSDVATSGAAIAEDVKLANDANLAKDAEEALAEATLKESSYGPDRVMRLFNVHTGERYEGPFWSQGRFVSAGLDQISYLLRDYRMGESLPIDPMVIDFMHSVYVQLGTAEPIQILSGYRSPETNAWLAKKSGNVARNSLHMQGRAIDFRVPGHSASQLRKLALGTRRGGVGYYRKSDFIHIDTGEFRHWDSGNS